MLLIVNGRVITRDEAHPYIEDGAVAIEGQKIVAVDVAASTTAIAPARCARSTSSFTGRFIPNTLLTAAQDTIFV